MVRMYSTHRPAQGTCCAAQRGGAFMLTALVITAVFSMMKFSNSNLNLEQQATSTSKSSHVSSDNMAPESSNNMAPEDAPGDETLSITSLLNSKFPSFQQGGVVVFYHASRTGGLTIRQNFINRPEDGIKYIKLGHSTQALMIADKIITHILNRNSVNNHNYNQQQETVVAVAPATAMYPDQGIRGLKNRVARRTDTMMMEDNPPNDAPGYSEGGGGGYGDNDGGSGGADGDAAASAGVVVEARRPAAETFVLEIPAELITLMQLSQLLQRWRGLAAEHEKSFFAFTLIRDPVPFHVSFLNTYSVPPLEPNVPNLLETMPRNEQCRRLVHNIVEGLESIQCQEAYDWMRKGLDWIGTTEKLNHDTLPILSHLLLQDASIGQSMPRFVEQESDLNNPNKLLVEYLSEQDETRIRELSDVDQKLYQDVLRDFSLETNTNEYY